MVCGIIPYKWTLAQPIAKVGVLVGVYIPAVYMDEYLESSKDQQSCNTQEQQGQPQPAEYLNSWDNDMPRHHHCYIGVFTGIRAVLVATHISN